MSIDPTRVRAARPDEVERALSVICAAFQIDCDAARPLYYQDPFFDLSHKRVLYASDGELSSCLTVVPATLLIGGVPVPLGGIAGVSTLPARQGQGHASRLLAATVGALADELGFAVSALFPLSYDYYRRFGWETASDAARWTGIPADLPRCAEADRVRLTQTPEARRAIRELHQTAAQGRTGACLRDARRWRVIEEMSPDRETAIYESPLGLMEGYLLLERRWEDEDRQTLCVQELHGLTSEARRALVGWLSRQAADAVEWLAAPSDLQEFGLGESVPEAGMMLRLCDLPAALRLLHSAHFGAVLGREGRILTLRATDALRPENERPVRLTPDGIEVGSADDLDWIAADIRQFAQLYTGYVLPSEAASRGLLTASSPEALALADSLFPLRRPFVAPADQF